MTVMSTATFEAFMSSRVVKSDGCWIATGSLGHHGYGRVHAEGRTQFAHRLTYEHLVGPIPEGLEIDHLCRNASCVNPDHLEPVTRDENMRRTRLERCHRGHDLVEGNLYESGGRRTCRPCAIDRSAERKARLRSEAPGPGIAKGERVAAAVLDEQAVLSIRERRSGGATYAELAEEFGVHVTTIASVCTRRTWAHVGVSS